MKNSCHFLVFGKKLSILFEDHVNFFLKLWNLDALNFEKGVLFFKHGQVRLKNLFDGMEFFSLSVGTTVAVWSLPIHFINIIISEDR